MPRVLAALSFPLFLLSIPIGAPSLAATWIVDPGGAGDFTTVTEAVLAAAPGDSLLIQPGSYNEWNGSNPVITDGKPLTLLGAGASPEDTTLRISLLFRSPQGDARVENLAFRGSASPLIWSVAESQVGTLTVLSCDFQENYGYATVRAGPGGGLIIEDCFFSGNSVYSGRGAAVYSSTPATEIRRCVFSHNSADEGGAVYALAGVLIEDCVFWRNSAPHGAAVMAVRSPTIRNCTFLLNETSIDGAAIEGSDEDWYIPISHCIIAMTRGGCGIECRFSKALECCDVWSNWWNGCGFWCDLNGPGDFHEDPLFCDPDLPDFGLRAGSPCLPGQHGGVPCGRVGARDLGCTGTPVERLSWGRIRTLFR